MTKILRRLVMVQRERDHQKTFVTPTVRISMTFQDPGLIPGLSRHGNVTFKFQDFPGSVRTLRGVVDVGLQGSVKRNGCVNSTDEYLWKLFLTKTQFVEYSDLSIIFTGRLCSSNQQLFTTRMALCIAHTQQGF